MKPVILAAALLFGLSGAVFAAGSETSNPPKPTETTKKCKKGEIFDQKTKTCAKLQSNRFSDDQLYEAAREVAYGGQYLRALDILNFAANPNDPRMLNYQGFVHRKLGKLALAMAYYKAAIAIDPNYVLARSYMGQGFVADGNMSAARQQLFEIERRGGQNSWAYASLEKSIRLASSSY